MFESWLFKPKMAIISWHWHCLSHTKHSGGGSDYERERKSGRDEEPVAFVLILVLVRSLYNPRHTRPTRCCCQRMHISLPSCSPHNPHTPTHPHTPTRTGHSTALTMNKNLSISTAAETIYWEKIRIPRKVSEPFHGNFLSHKHVHGDKGEYINSLSRAMAYK